MKGTIKFDHDCEKNFGKRIDANTCSQVLEFPVTKRYTASCNVFVENFCDDICNSPGFGKV